MRARLNVSMKTPLITPLMRACDDDVLNEEWWAAKDTFCKSVHWCNGEIEVAALF
jgi:hypothetical protein